MRADSRDAEVDAFLVPALAERLGVLIELQGAGRGAGGMVRLLAGRAEQHVQRVADDLGDGAVMLEYDIGHAGEIVVEQRPEHVRLKGLDQRGEAGDVGEHAT